MKSYLKMTARLCRGHLGIWLDQLDRVARWALLKLITGNIRIGVSARLAKTALADAFGKDLDEIEQVWHGLAPPYESLFAWLEGNAEKPAPEGCASFMPMMLSHPIEDRELEALVLSEFQVEPKWDGVRVQLARLGEQIALYSRTGDDISQTFPDIVEAALLIEEQQFVLDGELLTKDQENIAPFNALQQRLNRKKVTPAMLASVPAHIRLYDILVDNGEDIRSAVSGRTPKASRGLARAQSVAANGSLARACSSKTRKSYKHFITAPAPTPPAASKA